MNYGELIKKKRTELGIKQKEMAKDIGVSIPYLSNILQIALYSKK